MKRKIILLLLVFVVALSATAFARPYQDQRDEDNSRHKHQNQRWEKHDKWDHPSYRNEKWHKVHYSSLPFSWHESRDRIYRPGHIVERIYDYGWSSRFPGLIAYKWHDSRGEGFWYQGRHIHDAVMFYDDSDQLVSIGFMHNGTFLFIRDDDSGYENRDSFFLSWHW